MSSSVAPNQSLRQPVQKWLSNGHSLHAELRNELKILEAQLAVLKTRVQEKRAQIEQIAQVLTRAQANAASDEALRIRAPFRRPASDAALAPAPDDALVIPFRQ